MNYQEQLLSKNGLAVIDLAKTLLNYDIGDRVPTITELSERLDTARGTTQNALKTLENAGALRINSRGHLGSFLSEKNEAVLLKLAGINSLVGTMPLPYSRKYEGFATGLVSVMENVYDLPVTLSFMRGAKNRIVMVLEGRYDFAVISKYALQEFLKDSLPISTIIDFGPESYCSSHVMIFHDPKANNIKDGMKVGIDVDSVDQANMTKNICKGKRVEYVPVKYHTLLKKVLSGELDATIWNMDEIIDGTIDINYIKATNGESTDTEAVIVADSRRPEIIKILSTMINVDDVLHIQKAVEEGKITPSY